MCGAESSTEGVSNTEKVLGESWGQEKIIRERWMDGWGCWGDSEGIGGAPWGQELHRRCRWSWRSRCRPTTRARCSVLWCSKDSDSSRCLLRDPQPGSPPSPCVDFVHPPLPPPPCSRAGGCGALGSKVLTGDRAVQSCGTEGPRCADHPRSGAEPWEVPGNRRCAAPRVPLWVAAGEVGGTEHPRPLCPPHALLLPQPGGF